MLIDLDFLQQNRQTVAYLVTAVLFTNHLINSLILRYFGNTWQDSIYGGAVLAQVGELSSILSALASSIGIISAFGYQLAILVIALTLLISPFWIAMTKQLVKKIHPID